MPNHRTYERFIKGEGLSRNMASYLIGRSCWFQVDPYPDDEYCFTLKTENEHLFDRWLEEARKGL